MTMGRPPLPTKLKLLNGNPGKRPLPENEPKPREGVPTRPAWLLPEAKREWNRLVAELEPIGLLTKVDRATLAAFCQCWARYVEAEADITAGGIDYVTDKGFHGTRPSVGMTVKMLEKMATYGAKLGLSPADRTRLTVGSKKADDLDDLLAGNG